jgi:hypothetical protein
MNILTKVMLGTAVIFLMAAQLVTPTQKDDKEEITQPLVTLTPCALPTRDIARRLPWFIKFSDVMCTSLRTEDLQDSERLAALLIDVDARLQSESPFSDLKAEYDRALAAYGDGNYAEAISRLQAADGSGNSDQHASMQH